MKKMTWTLWASAAGLVLVISGLVLAADIPAGKETILLNDLEGKQPNVQFGHKKHVTELKGPDGKAITCQQCHHTLKTPNAEGETAQKCSACHVKPGVTGKVINGKTAPALGQEKGGKVSMSSVLYHKTCMDCHKAMKKEGKSIAGCKTCHNVK